MAGVLLLKHVCQTQLIISPSIAQYERNQERQVELYERKEQVKANLLNLLIA